MLGIENEEEHDIMFDYDNVLSRLTLVTKALDNWMAVGKQKTNKEFNAAIAHHRFKRFYKQWRSMNVEPKEWLDEQVKKIKAGEPRK
jgi:hypothetical protein